MKILDFTVEINYIAPPVVKQQFHKDLIRT